MWNGENELLAEDICHLGYHITSYICSSNMGRGRVQVSMGYHFVTAKKINKWVIRLNTLFLQ